MTKETAFTLAEVLITLGIIGVVAAMTMPSLIAHHQKTQMLTQLKRTYNVISNAIRMAVAEHGDVEGWVLNPANNIQASSEFANKYLIPYLQVIKNCETDTTGACSYTLTGLNGNDITSRLNGFSRFILNDGTLVFIKTKVNDATETFPKIVYVNVDINGQKKPNKSGRDYFEFAVALDTTQDMYRPTGRLNASGQSQTLELITGNENSSCSKSGNGSYCAALIIKSGWKLPENYPW